MMNRLSLSPRRVFSVKHLLVLMLALALSVVSSHKASASQPYALQYSQLSTSKWLSNGHTFYRVTFTFSTGGYDVNFPPSVTRLLDGSGNLTNDFTMNVSATGPSPGDIVTYQITKISATYDLGALTAGQRYTFTITQPLNPTTLQSVAFTP